MIYYITNNKQKLENIEGLKFQYLSIEKSIQMIQNTFKEVQLDTETTGLDPHLDKLLTLQCGNKAQNAYIVIDATTVDISIYKKTLESKCIIGHNLKFDLQFLFKFGITPKKVYDTMIVEQLLFLGYPPRKGRFALNTLVNKYLGLFMDKSIRSQINSRGLDIDVIMYAAKDVMYLEDIKAVQLNKLRYKKLLIGAQVECEFVPAIAYLEWCGIKLDVAAWKKKMAIDKEKLLEGLKELNQLVVQIGNPRFIDRDLFSFCGSTYTSNINWQSSKQVVPFLKYLGFKTKVLDKKTGQMKDSASTQQIKGQKGINDVFLNAYLKYSEAAKVCSTYGENYLNAINPETGRIHTTFRQIGTTSGRMACGSTKMNTSLSNINHVKASYPQLQNLPANEVTRSAFICEDGNLMCSADYSALESRLGANIYNDPAMLDEYINGSGDIHSLVAKACFPKELKGIDVKDIARLFPKLRSRAKPVEFSQQFGGSAIAIMNSLQCSLQEAEAIADNYNNHFTGIKAFKDVGSKFVRANGYILACEYTGHKVYWWDWKRWKASEKDFDTEFWDKYREAKEKLNKPETLDKWFTNKYYKKVHEYFGASSTWDRLALNVPTQATGIIILKIAAAAFYRWIIDNNLFNKVKLCDLVHDEMVIEYPQSMPEVANILCKMMQDAAAKVCTKLPIPAKPEVSSHWVH